MRRPFPPASGPAGGTCSNAPTRPLTLSTFGVILLTPKSPGGYAVTTTNSSDVYYDTYDVGINADPYPVYKRLREEAPVYYNEKHDFFAVSHFADVEKGLLDAQTYISGKGGIIELIKADIEMPPGVIIFEDPPTHTIHRRLLSRAFTPRRVAELEPKIREFCAQSLDPLVGAERFGFIVDLGRQMPLRVVSVRL